MKAKFKKSSALTPVILVVCISLVLFWEVMSWWSSRPYDEYELTADDFKDFNPTSPKWTIKSVPVRATPTEPDIVAKLLTPNALKDGVMMSTLVRLVHGYNMVDCMRIKRCQVELISDSAEPDERWSEGVGTHLLEGMSPVSASNTNRLQVWRVIEGGTADVSIWGTSMLQSSDFAGTNVDVRDMPFPRIGVPDDPNWQPTGLSWRSFRHPVRNLKWAFRARWNNSRRDVLTFLRLKQPAWASGEMLTLVSASKGVIVESGNEQKVIKQVLSAHSFMHVALEKSKGLGVEK